MSKTKDTLFEYFDEWRKRKLPQVYSIFYERRKRRTFAYDI